jgi:hypothetical protein
MLTRLLANLKLWVKRSLKILPIVFYSGLSAHNFSLVEPVVGRLVPKNVGKAIAIIVTDCIFHDFECPQF